MDHCGFVCFQRIRRKKRDSNVLRRRSTQYRKRDCNAFRRRSTQFKIETAMCSEEDRPNTKSRLQCVQKKIDPMQNRSCHVFRRRSISFVNAVIFRFQNLNTHKRILDGSSSHHHITNVMDHFGFVCFHRIRPNKIETAMCSEEDRLNTE